MKKLLCLRRFGPISSQSKFLMIYYTTYGISGLFLASAPECPAVKETLVVNIPLVWTPGVALNNNNNRNHFKGIVIRDGFSTLHL
jgi:hypothetical protein